MSAREIITGAANPILRAISQPLKQIDSAAKKLAKDLEDTLIANPGLGLAAPQIGVNQRIILVKLNSGKDNETYLIMVNPIIEIRSEETVIAEEGCLSLPEVFVTVSRSREIIVKYIDLKNRPHRLQLADLNARIVQHEIDHLDGILIVDKAVTGRPDNALKSKLSKPSI